MADRGILPVSNQPASEAIEKDPWNRAWIKLVEMFPNRIGKIMRVATRLNENQDIITDLPITKTIAKTSQEFWMDRFAMILYSLSLRGYVQNQRLGLSTLIYVGGAHRWPHRHLSWTARLGNPNEKPPYLQIMVMPPSSVERIRRIKPNISEEVWSASTFNSKLYDNKTQNWKTNHSYILQALSSEKSRSQLNREFDIPTANTAYIPTMEEAKALSLMTFSMSMNSLELGEYNRILGFNQDKLATILRKLISQGVLNVQYLLYLSDLVSTCIICEGPELKINSISRAFLKHTPSTTVRITDDGKKNYIISRIPSELAYQFSIDLTREGAKNDIDIKIMRINAFAAYTHNLYSRLLQKDGTWDDDISGFLSQIRS